MRYSIPLCPPYYGGLRPPNSKSNEPFLPEAVFLGICHNIKSWLRQLLMLFSRRLHVLLIPRGCLDFCFCCCFVYYCCICVYGVCVRVCARTHMWRSAALESQSSPSSFMRNLGTKLRLPDLHSKSPLTTDPPTDLPSWFWERISHLPGAFQLGWMASNLFISAFPVQGLHSSVIHSHHDKQSSQGPKAT